MGYVKKPEPADDVVIFEPTDTSPGWTWGEHRHMQKMLDELEKTDADVAAARQKLDYRLREAGWLSPEGEEPTYCEFCWNPPEVPHDKECPDGWEPDFNQPRWRGAYQFFNATFTLLHTTSVPMDDEEAMEYVKKVGDWFPDETPTYVWARDLRGTQFNMLPWSIDPDTLEVTVREQ